MVPFAEAGRSSGGEDRLLAVVVAYNSEAVLHRCVTTLASAAEALFLARGLTTSLVVVDNASQRPVALPDVELDCAVVALEENIGFAPAANAGANCGPSRLILFLNPDTALAPSALVHLVAAFDQPSTALAGPMLLAESGEPILSERPFHSLRRELCTQFSPWRRHPPFGRREYATGYGRCLVGACLLVEREFFEAVDGFDAAIRMYLEDVELCWQAHAAGRDVRFVPDARCAHGLGAGSDGESFRSLIDLHLTLLAARVEFVRRRSGQDAVVAMRASIAVGALVRAAAFALRRRGWQRHMQVFRWAAASGEPPRWESVRRVRELG
jgi:N-acetylglucosaminyl-diphospho-decaprenol L-rhamnosyltransferase